MLSSVLVVVIVGVIIAVIVVMTVSDGPKPATPPPAHRREVPEAEPTVAAEPAPPPDERIPAFPAPVEEEPLAPSWAQRMRAAVLLGVSVLALGSVAAAVIGGTLFIGIRMLDRALG